MRAGTPCKRIDVTDKGRGRLHGGLSTGPKTKAGKLRAPANRAVGPPARCLQS
ncbi:MAG: HGGxSTG domain-containing protein [Caulobacteraceae bacterium]